jgi:hypothetical protein
MIRCSRPARAAVAAESTGAEIRRGRRHYRCAPRHSGRLLLRFEGLSIVTRPSGYGLLLEVEQDQPSCR